MKFYCSECNAKYSLKDEEIPEKGATTVCKNCGNKIAIAKPQGDQKSEEDHKTTGRINQENNSEAENKPLLSAGDVQFRSFVFKNREKYLLKFRAFKAVDREKFSVTWNWPAFFIPPPWLLYRKMYLWGILSIVLAVIPLINILASIGFGMTGNYIYYKHAKKKINEIIDKNPDVSERELNILLTIKGGVSYLLPIVMIVIAVTGIFVAIAVPQFNAYRMRAYNITAQNDLRNAAAAQENYYIAKSKYTDSLKDITGDRYNFFVSKDVVVQIISADKDSYCMVAFNKNGNKKYQINGTGGEITEVPSLGE
jgi:predicted Zn finger-like uncharacterized protein